MKRNLNITEKGLLQCLLGIILLFQGSHIGMGSAGLVSHAAGFVTGGISGTTYYVSGSGNDANSGTSPDQAWKSISKVNRYGSDTGFQPGDSIRFKGGDVFNDAVLDIVNSGTEGHPIVFCSYGEGKALLTRPGIDHDEIIRILDQKYFTIENLEISNPDFDPSKVSRGIRIEFTKDGEYPGITIRNNYIHDIHGGLWTNRHLRGGIWMRSRKDVHAYTLDMLVENNRIERCHTRGMRLNAEGTAYHKNLIVRNNYVDNTGQAGIQIGYVDGGRIEGNTVYRAGNYYPEGDQAGVLAACWAAHSKNIIIQHNEVAYTKLGDVNRPDGNLNESSHDSQAFDIDVTAPGWHLIQYNYTHDNEGGFFLWMGKPGPDFEWAVIRYNLSLNDGKGFDNRLFELHSHENDSTYPVYVYNNTFVNDERIWMNNRTPDQDNHKGWIFENNIFHAPEGQYDDQRSIVYHNNLYWPAGGPVVDSMSRHADPRLLNPGTCGDGWENIQHYKIGAASPAIDRAVVEASRPLIDAGERDLFGNSLTLNHRAIGAHDRQPVPLEYLVTDTIFLSATDFDLEESADSICFYANDSLLATDTSAPFEIDWIRPDPGEYTMQATAYHGGTGADNPLPFTIKVYGYLKAENPGTVLPGLIRDYYQDSWHLLPDFSKLKVNRKDTVSNFYTEPYSANEKYAIRFTGFVNISQRGKYAFYLNVTDAGRLYTGDRLLIDNNGIHESAEINHSVLLDSGFHRLQVTMLNNTGEGAMNVYFEGPGIEKQMIPDSILFRPRGVPPEVSVVMPSNKSVVNEGDTVRLKASVVDMNDDVCNIEFYTDHQLIGSIADSGYILSIDTLQAGTHILFAKAYDLGGFVSVSESVTVTVNAAPVITLVSPEDQSEYTRSDTVRIEFPIEDENLKRAELYVNNMLIKTFTSGPFYHELTKLDLGSYFIRIIAVDSLDLEASAKIEVKVVNAVPAVSIVKPTDGSVFQTGEEITFKALVSDPDDDVYKVAFYNGEDQIGTNANLFNETSVRNLPAGEYAIVARAFDKAGAISESVPVNITVRYPASAGSQALEDISLFPNPLKSGYLTIRVPGRNRTGRMINVRITDISGRMIWSGTINRLIPTIKLSYDLFRKKGMYFIMVPAGDTIQTYKLIVQ